MAGIRALSDYFRDSVGNGINAATYSVKRLFDNASIASGSTVSDTVPATSIPGYFAIDETSLGYPGPISFTVSDAVTGAVRNRTSKSTGIFGAVRAADLTRGWRIYGNGVIPGVLGELAVTADGTDLILTVAAGSMLAAMQDHGLVYSWPVTRALTATTADATNPRIDTAILRFYPPGVAQEGRIDLVLLPGTPNASPVAPTLTQNIATVWEVALADIRVDAGVTAIAAGKVTDRRTWSFIYPAGVVAGDIFYADASGKLARLAKGTSGQALVQGAAIPAWGSLANTSVTGLGTMSTQNASAVAITGGSIAGTTLTNTDIETINVSNLTLQDNADATKQVKFSAAAIATATTRTLSLPDATDTLVGKATTDTLTNKTLTQPNIGDFTAAIHDHHTNATGGTLAVAAYPTMTGDTGTGGVKGAVPAPGAGDAAANKYLKADATWTVVPTGDASTNTATSVDGEGVLFSGTSGKLLKRSSLTGIIKQTAGVSSAVTAPTGAIVGTTDAQTLSNKTLDNTTVETIKDGNLTLQSSGDATKQVKFDLSFINVSTTRTLTMPNATDTLVARTTADTLTNKTLTTPTIADLTNMQHDHSNAANGGALAARNPVVYVPFTYDGHAGGVNVTNTGNAVPSQLASTFTLLNGVVYDVMLTGAVEVGAPASDYIYVGGQISSVFGTVIGEGTAGGERTLFVTQGRTLTGTGAALNCGLNVKVGSGTGVFNSGSFLLTAIPRT